MKDGSVRALVIPSVGIALLLAAACARADQFDRARAQIRYVMTLHHVPSVSVAVAHKGNIVWEESFGWADIENKVPATPHTTYSLASISKPITATALMMLVERGAIELDKPIDEYLGSQKITARVGSARDATVRRVASHTAGLPLHVQFFYDDEGVAIPKRDETIRRYATLVDPPGERFVYSNIGYGLLEWSIERASGKSYAQLLEDELFNPLGLSSALVNQRPTPEKPIASRYWLGTIRLPFYESDQQGGGGVFMSAHDLVRFGMFHLHGHIDGQHKSPLKKSTLASMQERVHLNDGSPADYGIGWFVGEQHGLQRINHNGGMAGVASVLSIYPEAEAVIVVLANGVTVTGAVHFLERDIVHALLPDTIRHDHGFKPQPELVGRWQGHAHTYNGQIPVELDIRENGSVFARVGTNPLQEVVNVKLDPKTSFLQLDDLIGTIDTPDAARYPGKLQLSLKRRASDTLSGSISANATERLADRMGSAVSYWVELRRKPEEAALTTAR
jgi:CubicO group peptidase (beta-lactamase class C family)